MPSKDWEAHKHEINRLYMVEGKPKEKVMQIMENNHGFIASKWQYENQFRRWGFKKNLGGSRIWVYVRETNKRRKLKDKNDVEVFIDGIPQSPGSIATGIRRHAYETVIEEKINLLGSTTAHNTRRRRSMLSSLDLRWETIMALRPSLVQLFQTNLYSQDICSAPSNMTRNFWNTPSAQFRRGLLQTLGSAAPSALAHCPRAIPSASQTAMMMNPILPEEQKGQHTATARSLLRRSASGLTEISLALYMLANGFELTSSHDNSLDESNLLQDILGLTSFDNLPSMKNLLSLEGLTAKVLAHKIFETSVFNMDEKMIRIMLEAGMDTNVPIYHNFQIITPLQAVSGADQCIAVELANLLLSHGACTEATGEFYPALFIAFHHDNKELFDILLANGAKLSSHILCLMAKEELAEEDDRVPYFQALVDAGADLKSAIEEGVTLLGLVSNAKLIRWFIKRDLDVNAPQRYTRILYNPLREFHHTTRPLGIRAIAGDIACMRALLEADAEVTLPLEPDGAVPPLVLAVQYGHTEATQLLLDTDADVKDADQCKLIDDPSGGRTLLERAGKDLELFLPLLRAGAWAPEYERQDILCWPMLEAVKSGDIATVASLVGLGASVNSYDRESSLSAIALAIRNGDLEMMSMLKKLGASIAGSPIPTIFNVQTAVCLEHAGWLDHILSLTGRSILASAILQREDALVLFLLDKAGSHSQYFITPRADEISNPSASPLGSSFYMGNLRLAQVLISLGAWANESDLNMMVCQALEHNNLDSLNQLRMTPSLPRYIPTAFGMALQTNDLSVVHYLLKFNFSPRGHPVVLFDLVKRRIMPPKPKWCKWDYKGTTWWNITSPFPDVEILKLDSVLLAAFNHRVELNTSLINLASPVVNSQ
ncbi:hypothetical protein PMG11_10118 [Penicillium brasilianum]|uniref:Clr5 domain-containing protein n=1 Tax=Penicillium brasilianum TaxID=104259 RepID=A0A0F7TY54_PENBI|nr:hypothetical protein PMG11_10118 [Penicillium brasilianum]